jgi:hypothetical protein
MDIRSSVYCAGCNSKRLHYASVAIFRHILIVFATIARRKNESTAENSVNRAGADVLCVVVLDLCLASTFAKNVQKKSSE